MAVDLTRFLPMFFQEAEEHLAAMERHLVQLDPRAPDPEVLHSIFRAAHSVKGSSAILGASQFADVMHRLENILDRLRRAELALDNTLVNLLLHACDVVRAALTRLKDTGETDAPALQTLFDRLAQPAQAAAVRGKVEATADSLEFRNQRLHVSVQVPAEQGIASLPLASLYAALGALGRLEDLQTAQADGAATLSLYLLTPVGEDEIGAKVKGLLGDCTVRVEHLESAPPALQAASTASAPAADTACGWFGAGDHELQLTDPGVRDSAVSGRRSSDAAPSHSVFGRRTADRLVPLHDRSSIRVDVEKVDRLLNLVGELVIAQSMLTEAAGQVIERDRHSALANSVGYVARQTRELQEAVMGIRLLPIDFLFSRIPRLTRDLAHRLGKEVDLQFQGGDTELDREMIEKLADPLTHLVRNSLDHGIEAPRVRVAAGKPARGRVEMRAKHQGGGIVIEITDDGSGFDRDKILAKAQEGGARITPSMSDEDAWQLVFAPGFTTANAVSEVSGRGVGMDVVKRNIQALGGNIDIRSQSGVGTSILIRLPLTLSILDGMSVDIDGESYVIPLSFIAEAFQPQPGQIKTITGGPQVMQVRESYLPVLAIEQMLGVSPRVARPEDGIAVVLEVDGRRAAMLVDRLVGQQQVVIKSLEANYRRVRGLAGATVMGNGRVALILDVDALMRSRLTPLKNLQALGAESATA